MFKCLNFVLEWNVCCVSEIFLRLVRRALEVQGCHFIIYRLTIVLVRILGVCAVLCCNKVFKIFAYDMAIKYLGIGNTIIKVQILI